MMGRTLYSKLVIALVLLLLVIGLVYTLLSLSANRHFQQKVDQQLNRDLAANLVMERNLVVQGKLDQKALKDTFMAYMVINPSIEIYLLDLKGNILAYSADPGKVKRSVVNLKPINSFLKDERAFPLLGDDPRSESRQKAFSVTPVPTAEAPEGYLYVVLRGEQYDDVEQLIQSQLVMQLSGWAVAGSLLFGLLAGLLLFHLLTRRLNQLSLGIAAFHQSDFSQPPRLPEQHQAGDEVDGLIHSFNAMANRISEQMAQLKQQDALRRELVANVSHDLRTPLAILHGYLETLQMKSAELDPQQQRQYLSSALHNSAHLENLVAALFELSKLEAHETVPQLEPFHPAELAQDVVQKFQLAAQQQGVTLHFEASQELPFVKGDIALIERVLENLLGNALKHTEQGGDISLILQPVDRGVEIAVADSGCGIDEQALPHIFDRFYQVESDQRDSTGLGLAIAKRILVLHESDLLVSSRKGEGSIFRFTLGQTVFS